jgi:hypothetical protein
LFDDRPAAFVRNFEALPTDAAILPKLLFFRVAEKQPKEDAGTV